MSKNKPYDVIVVGARCAGAPAAMLLARHGHRVLLLDRAELGSDTFSGNFIHQPGVAALQRWGLLQALQRTKVPPVRATHFDVGPFALTGTPPPIGRINVAYAPRRTILDRLLVEAAVEAGAEFRECCSLRELLFDGKRVCGIRVSRRGRTSEEIEARLVIGADGKNSRVARLVNARVYNAHPAATCNYGRYYADLPVRGAELYVRDGHFIVAVPTHDNLTLVNVACRSERFHEFRSDITGTFHSLLASAPGLMERVQCATPASRFLGTGDLDSFFRRPFGEGWALAGDAGYYKDPITAQGITDAFLDAELVSQAAHRLLTQGDSGAMEWYEDSRNQRVGAMYQLTGDLAQLAKPNDDMQMLFTALRGSQSDCDRFMGVVAGTVPVHDFFSPENMTRIIGEYQHRLRHSA